MSRVNQISPKQHVDALFKEFTTPSRILQSFTNLSNTVIETALSGQNKFLFEILQNADDSYEDERKAITIQFILDQNHLIVLHNGKGFDYYDVERICDYASQIKEVKATDLSKTGYKGLGFKSLFNVSDCIYVYSDGYSFRFDKTYWSDSSNRPWQVIPIWCESKDLPLRGKYQYNQPVNIILRVTDVDKFKIHLLDLVKQPELLLYLNHIDKIQVYLDGKNYSLSRNVKKFGLFNKVNIYKNESIVSTWLMRTYKQSVTKKVQDCIQGASRFIYPDKIQTANEVPVTFALQTNQSTEKILKIEGFFYNTLPTQLRLMFPYHINSFFILNLDRTQLHENEWNEFLMHQIGQLQLHLLKDLAEIPCLKNYVVMQFVSKINHSFAAFRDAFLKGLNEAKIVIGWLPAYKGSHLLKITEAWTDETEFFKQNFKNISDQNIQLCLIDYDVKGQHTLPSEVKRFTYDQLFKNFPGKYFPQLDKASYINFISYLYQRTTHSIMLTDVRFLLAKDKTLLSPRNAILEESKNPIPHFLKLNPIDNEYLPSSNLAAIKEWLVGLGSKWIKEPVDVIRESIMKWSDYDFKVKINMQNHVEILNYLEKSFAQLTNAETKKLKEKLHVFTENNQLKLANLCYFPDAMSEIELPDIISKDDKISSQYDTSLKGFLAQVGVKETINPIEVLRKILVWSSNNTLKQKLTVSNYVHIIEYMSLHYPSSKNTLPEKALKKMPILTCDKSFQKAEDCYFDDVVPDVKGLEGVIAKNRLVSTANISRTARDFLKRIGVSDEMPPAEILRRSVIRWVKEGQIQEKITLDNHIAIFKYISETWRKSTDYYNCHRLTEDDKKALKKYPILTKNGEFSAAENCYFSSPTDPLSCTEIPELKSVISSDELVSMDNYPKDSVWLLEELGVKKFTFNDIYEKYSDHLTCDKNIEWFFRELVKYWETNCRSYYSSDNKIMNYLQKKFQSKPCLLAKNRKMHSSTELYSSQFNDLHSIDPNTIILLNCNALPKDLEKKLGFKTELELICIKQLLEAVREKPNLGKEKNLIFFKILLEQLEQKDANEIKKHQLSLFSQENKLMPAKNLYYFEEENSVCFSKSRYLKRIHGMSHDDTLKLAKLTGVNVIPFNQTMNFGEQVTRDNSLKEYYLARLPFFVLQESALLCETSSTLLEELYNKICSIELYKCHEISVEYVFDKCEILQHFDDLKIYVKGKWNGRLASRIFDHVNEKLDLKKDVRDLLDMPINSEEIQNWLLEENEDKEKLYSIMEELRNLRSVKINALKFPQNEKANQGDDDEDIDQQDEHNIQSSPSKHKRRSTHKTPRRRNRPRKKELGHGISVEDCYSSTSSLNINSSENDREDDIKWLSEKFVFDFLQDQYKNQYPNSQSSVSNGIFELHQQPLHKLKITWLNETEEQGHQYDLLLEEDGIIKQLIEVESSDMTNVDSFSFNTSEFIKRINCLALEQPDNIEKYCIYCVFNINNASNAAASTESKPSALYKIGPMNSM